MKRLLIFILAMLPIVAHATSMCVHSNSYVAQLSTTRDGISSSVGENGAWTVTMDYATSSFNEPYVKGFGACTEVAGTENTADATVQATGGETSGPNCWCGMKAPMSSDWVYVNTYPSIDSCTASCAQECAERVKTSTACRSAMFQAIW